MIRALDIKIHQDQGFNLTSDGNIVCENSTLRKSTLRREVILF